MNKEFLLRANLLYIMVKYDDEKKSLLIENGDGKFIAKGIIEKEKKDHKYLVNYGNETGSNYERKIEIPQLSWRDLVHSDKKRCEAQSTG